MPFLTNLDTRVIPDGMFRLLAPLRFQDKTGKTHTVEVGAETNFANLPAPVRILMPVNGKHRRAATLHDDLYQRGSMSRKDADRLFLEAMKDTKVNIVIRHVM